MIWTACFFTPPLGAGFALLQRRHAPPTNPPGEIIVLDDVGIPRVPISRDCAMRCAAWATISALWRGCANAISSAKSNICQLRRPLFAFLHQEILELIKVDEPEEWRNYAPLWQPAADFTSRASEARKKKNGLAKRTATLRIFWTTALMEGNGGSSGLQLFCDATVEQGINPFLYKGV